MNSRGMGRGRGALVSFQRFLGLSTSLVAAKSLALLNVSFSPHSARDGHESVSHQEDAYAQARRILCII